MENSSFDNLSMSTKSFIEDFLERDGRGEDLKKQIKEKIKELAKVISDIGSSEISPDSCFYNQEEKKFEKLGLFSSWWAADQEETLKQIRYLAEQLREASLALNLYLTKNPSEVSSFRIDSKKLSGLLNEKNVKSFFCKTRDEKTISGFKNAKKAFSFVYEGDYDKKMIEEIKREISRLKEEISYLKKTIGEEDKKRVAEANPQLLKEIFSTEVKFHSSLKMLMKFVDFLKNPELFLEGLDLEEVPPEKVSADKILKGNQEQEEDSWIFVSKETELSSSDKKLLEQVKDPLERLIKASSVLVQPYLHGDSSFPEFDAEKEPDLDVLFSFYSSDALESYFEALIDYSKVYQNKSFSELVSRSASINWLKDASNNRAESLAIQPIQRGPRHELLLRGLSDSLKKKAADSPSAELIDKMLQLVVRWMILLNENG